MSFYTNEKWKVFRANVIAIDEGRCVDCGRSDVDGVVLQVHHKRYIKNKKPWEYSFDDCETLCQGCHAREHGEIRPSYGWSYEGESDLGDLVGVCELCGTAIRYVHYVSHRHWEPMEVGTDCCDNLTGTEDASNARKKIARYKRFLMPTRWATTNTLERIFFKDFSVEIVKEGHENFYIRVNGRKGQKNFRTSAKAKEHAFDAIDSEKMKKYFSNKKLHNKNLKNT